MAAEFEDIKIVSFDEDASYKSDERSSLTNCVLRLSSLAPSDWAEHFNQSWKEHFCMTKRNATASGDRIEVLCVPEELQNLINELKKVIAATNRAYGQHVSATQQRAKQQEESAAAEKERLTKVKNTLTFD